MLVAILNLRVEDIVIYMLGNFLVVLQVGFGFTFFSLHTHFICISWVGPYTWVCEV